MERIDQQLFEIGKIQPHALELEEGVLGAMMLEKEVCNTIMPLLKIPVFYKEHHQIIFKAILRLYERKEPIDPLTVVNELKVLKQLEVIGGAYYVTQLTNKVASAGNAEYHSRILLQQYFKREQIRIATDTLRKAYDPYTDPFDIQEEAVSAFKSIGSFLPSNSASDNQETISNVMSDIKSAKNKGGIIGYSTGIKNLDWAIMGLRKGFTYVFAALPGTGKTSLGKSIGISLAARQNVPGVFFSLEITKEMLMTVCISEILQIPNENMQRGELTEVDQKRIDDVRKTLFASNFLIVDKPGLSPSEIRSILAKLKESHKIEWFIIDYIRLMRLKGKEHRGKTLDAVLSDITVDLKNTAKELDLICIELAQMNKEGSKRKDPRPILTDIRDSGSVEANADVVILPYRPEKLGISVGDTDQDTGHTELIIAKNRFGPIKTVAAIFKHAYTQFVNNDNGVELDTKYNPSADPDAPPSF